MKKIFITVCAVFFLALTAVSVSASTPYADVPEKHWAYDAVMTLASQGISEGYGDGSFRGDKNITRYEAATMIAKMLASNGVSSGKSGKSFSDIPAAHWARNSVMFLSGASISQGYSDNTFRGDRNITRYEMAVMVAKMISINGISPTGANPFSDIPSDHWALDSVKLLASKGINEGYGDGSFRGNRNITRYEAAMMLAKAFVSN